MMIPSTERNPVVMPDDPDLLEQFGGNWDDADTAAAAQVRRMN